MDAGVVSKSMKLSSLFKSSFFYISCLTPLLVLLLLLLLLLLPTPFYTKTLRTYHTHLQSPQHIPHFVPQLIQSSGNANTYLPTYIPQKKTSAKEKLYYYTLLPLNLAQHLRTHTHTHPSSDIFPQQ
ncbi:hypothetical protein BDU57DRAFT_511708 [Ampelomyces quisqualis]|uniref:Uncharacterized protein n=1 Tax=Ampelomyces quisqualis TaxID=50730 RepID=A0A6A5QWE5_AMPQU|nr:hypothetical protein BDU57DRAFT_511708 [Ampelomyces quisqualis]